MAHYPKLCIPNLLSKRRWRQLQVLADRFWAAFIKIYLLGLQTGGKWKNSLPDIKVRMAVILVDPQLPRSLWKIGKVTKIFPGPD